jgi:allantoin racemase
MGQAVRVAFCIGDYPAAERKRREDVALGYAMPGVEVGIVSVATSAYNRGNSPAELDLVAPAFIDAYQRAEAEGYDAAVPLGALDLAVDSGRSAVDIPIIGPAEAMLHIACMLGDRFGLLVYSQTSLILCRRIVKRYGMRDKVVAYRESGFHLPDIAANRETVVANFVANAKSLVEEHDCDVILPMGITQCPVHVKPDWLSAQLGVPVVEGIGAPIRLAAMFAGLGLRHSRRHWPRSPLLPASASPAPGDYRKSS